MRGATRRLPLGALLTPLLLLLAATSGSYARPQSAPGLAVQAQAGEAEQRENYFAPGAWRPVGIVQEDADVPRSNGAAPYILQAGSRVRVEETNRSSRVDKNNKAPASPSTPATTAAAAGATATAIPEKATPAAPSSAATATTATPSATAAPTPKAAAAAAAPTAGPAASLGGSIHTVTSQLLTAAEDVRTPPKLRHQQETRGQGVAVPVILEEDELAHPEEVLTRHSTTSKTPEEGISTWVLLSGSHSSSSTPTPQRSTTPKSPKPTTTKRPTTARPSAAPPKRTPSTTKKPSTTTAATTASTTAAAPTGTTAKAKPAQNGAASRKNATVVDAPLAPAMTRKPPTTVHKTTAAPTTTSTTTTPTPVSSTLTSTTVDVVVAEDDYSTLSPAVTDTPEGQEASNDPEAKTETATRRTRRPGTGNKKKKNKNKRRKNRPSTNNSTAIAESKIGEAGTNSTKPPNKDRPLSTRIYNYLAREVMPSFGVGLLGLAITAGLAGLIMYPFGGGAVRRTYEVDPPALPQQGNFYYYGGEYEGDDHGQAEESVIRKVFEGMNTENEQPEDAAYSNQRYSSDSDSTVGSGTVTTYAGDVQPNRYPTNRYDSGQSGYTSGTGQGTYNSQSSSGYASASRPDQSSFYNVEQANKYYSSSAAAPSLGVGTVSAASTGSSNDSADPTNGGRVRYREVATGSVVDPSASNTQQITKKSDYYAYNTGRVRYRDVGTGEVNSDYEPRVRFREVGSDTVHYNWNDQSTSSDDSGVEHGPRHVRVRRSVNMVEKAQRMETIQQRMVETQQKMAAKAFELAVHAKEMSDKTKELTREIQMVVGKKNKPKKSVDVSKPAKSKKGNDCDRTKSNEDDSSDIDALDAIFGEVTTPGEVQDVELVTGVPDTTSVSELLPPYMSYQLINSAKPSVIQNTNNGPQDVNQNTNNEQQEGNQPTNNEQHGSNDIPNNEQEKPTENDCNQHGENTNENMNTKPEETHQAIENDDNEESTDSAINVTEQSIPETTIVNSEEEEPFEPTDAPVFTTEAAIHESSTHSLEDDFNADKKPSHPHKPTPTPTDATFVDLIRQIAHLKFKLGLNFLKTTSDAFSSYVDHFQKHMEEAVKQSRSASFRRANFWNFRRAKRDAKKSSHLKKKGKSD